ncbi:MAG: FkbM family methyltransferase [Coriobacteriia bacterium]|nr:FkbM family methyltransferase [Coriobacteriia bacterium]
MSADPLAGRNERAAGAPVELAALLDLDPREWRVALDKRYRVLDEVLAGNRRTVVYPAASMGRKAAARLLKMGVKVVAFGDSDPTLHGEEIDGLPVLSPAEIATVHTDDVVLVASAMHDSAICEDLTVRGLEAVVPIGYLNLRLPDVFVSREYQGAFDAATSGANRTAIEAAYALFSDDESRRVFLSKLRYYLSLEKDLLDEIGSAETVYFGAGVYDLSADEVVVDGGAYVGDTLESFLQCSSGQFDAYYAFEPDGASYDRLAQVAATDPQRITAVRAGLGRHTSSARLLSTAGADSRLLGDDEPGGDEVPVVGLDDYFAGRPAPSLIKMDIEGSESDALLGAAGLLSSATPKLAVSAYHLPADLWTIPLLIRRLAPGSDLFLRHHSREIDDTVCYAVPRV